jgi:hypothetical protein
MARGLPNFINASRIDYIREDCKSDTRYGHWGDSNATWGEAGIVRLLRKITSKIFNIGLTCMFSGYLNHHASGTYRMWGPRS